MALGTVGFIQLLTGRDQVGILRRDVRPLRPLAGAGRHQQECQCQEASPQRAIDSHSPGATNIAVSATFSDIGYELAAPSVTRFFHRSLMLRRAKA